MKLGLKLLSFLLLVGCASKKEDFKTRTVDGIYNKARSLLKGGEYTDAASEFKDIETLFPYSSKANEGQIMAAYCYFLASDYLSATREIEVFLRYHPSHEFVPYAMYLKAMCIYMQVVSLGRDSRAAMDAKHAFVELANKFPDSEYYRDALKRIIILDDIIAAHEMAIGRYYQKNRSHLAATGRYMFVSSQLSSTKYAEEALYRIVECCYALGLKEEAKDAYRALKSDLPSSSWTKKAELLIKKII
ncbi:MAG: outer membrane protein assembly factor BamD [Holosporaceae bacterium]|jgi:outer membrane protein assembly factor BamD|nr:outer membrane protein assembly factor BamD [Holosporaceae bacterium]